MATYQGIAATSEALRSLLDTARPRDVFPKAEIKLFQANDLRADKPLAEGISLYLYRIIINTTRRSLPPRLAPDGKRYRPSLPVDLYYLLTPWGADAYQQHRLLGWAMRTLENSPILPASLLNLYGFDPAQETFRPNEAVELICEPLSLQDLVNAWEAFKPAVQLSVGYVVRTVVIDSEVLMPEEGPPVQVRGFDFGKAPA